MNRQINKPIIETIINTAALALTSYGVQAAINENYFGYIALGVGMFLEFTKYYGRKIKLWS